MPLSVAQMVKKYKTNARNSVQSYVDGVRSTPKDPMRLAIDAIPRYEQGVRDAVSSGRLERGLSAVSKASWQDSCEKIGAKRYSDGIDKGEAKYAAHMAIFAPEQARITAEVQAMPKTTLSERLQRMVRQAELTAELKGISKGRGR